MAEKEATVFVVDVGKSMGEKNHGRKETDLNWAMTYVWDRMTSIIALDRKTTLQAVITVRSNESHNDMSDDPDYQHVSVLQNLKALSLGDLRKLQEQIQPSKTEKGDAISALVIAMDLIEKTCKKLKYIRRIVMVTSGKGSWSGEQLDEIADQLQREGIQLTVLGVDFGPEPESESSVKTERSKEQIQHEGHIRKILREDQENSNGVFGSLSEAIDELGIPRLKATRPVPSFKGFLSLGDPANYDDALTIDVERYPRTMVRRPATASAFVTKEGTSSTAAPSDAMDVDGDTAGNLALVRNQRMYEVIDANFDGGKKEVAYEELAKGYEYGRTAVHVSESDMPILRMETKPGLELIGFIPTENYDRYMAMSRSNVVLAQRANTKAIMALSSLVHALHELSSVAVARFIPKADKSPTILLLAPCIEPDAEYLVDIQLPFAEDVRVYRFPPLDRVILASGKTLTIHRHLPDPKLQNAMDAYVNAMDLDTYENRSEWDPAAFAGTSEESGEHDAFSPVLHRIDQAVRFRATHPSDTIPPPYPILTKYMSAPRELVPVARLSDLIEAAGVKKVPKDAGAGRRRQNRQAAAQTVSGLDVAGLLAKRTPQPKVDPSNPIPSFKQMLDTTRDPDGIQAAADQLGRIIEGRVQRALGGSEDARILEEMRVLRSEMIEMEEPKAWNRWALQFRQKLLQGKLGGERRELWWKVRAEGNALALVEGGRDGVSPDEAAAYWSLKVGE